MSCLNNFVDHSVSLKAKLYHQHNANKLDEHHRVVSRVKLVNNVV